MNEARTRPSEPPTERRHELNRRLRTAFIAGAEHQWRRTNGRGLSNDELVRVLARYPGRTTINSAGRGWPEVRDRGK